MPNVIEHIARLQKPGSVATWWAAQLPEAMALPLVEEEQKYLELFTSSQVDPRVRIRVGIANAGNLSAEDRERMTKRFGDDPGVMLKFLNYENRRRIIAHYVLLHPATLAYMVQLYRVSRDVNPIMFIAERLYELCTGNEAFTGEQVSRTRATVDILLAVVVGRALGQVVRAARPVVRTRPTRALTDPIYDMPEDGGGMMILDRWYTEHALERMAPDTPTVRAQLSVRAAKRLAKLGITPDSPVYDQCLGRAMQKIDPRGVPPSVIEAEILRPGTTGVRVITAQRGRVVVTVIPGH